MARKILFLGDSITVGVGASEEATRFSTLVARELNAGSGDLAEVNLGVSGTTLCQSGYPDVLPRALDAKPDIFVIAHGVNDNACGNSSGQFLWAYRETVRTVRRRLPETLIVCMTICPSWNHYNSNEEWLRLANTGIQEIAAQERTLLAQTHRALHNRRELFPDSMHPNDDGHRTIAESVVKAIRENRRQSEDNFDFIGNGAGFYRLCGYVVHAHGEVESPEGGWIEFVGLRRDGFGYRSDYCLDVVTPEQAFPADMAVDLRGDGGFAPIRRRADYIGMVSFPLPQTGERFVNVKIAPCGA